MVDQYVTVVCIIILWVGIWGILDLTIDVICKKDKIWRYISYIILIIIGVVLCYFFGIPLE